MRLYPNAEAPWLNLKRAKTDRPRVKVIILSATRAKLDELSNELTLDAIDEQLSFPDEGAAYKLRQARFRMWGYDGKKHLFSKTSLSFPLGFVDIVKRVLRKQQYRIKTIDRRKNLPKPRKPKKLTINLYDHQEISVERFCKHERGVLKIPTAGGKTYTAAGCIAKLGMPRTLVIVHKRNLAVQARESIAKALGTPVGMIGDGTWDEKQVTVAMLQTLTAHFHLPAKIKKAEPATQERMLEQMKRVKKLLKSTEFLILDECHHAAATTWKAMADRCSARWRLGLSGTPLDREDGRSPLVIATTGPVLHQVKARTLIKRGKIAEPYITFVPIIKCERGKTQKLYEDAVDREADWPTAYSEGIVHNEYRNWKALQIAKKNATPVMILTQRHKHAENIQELAKKIGMKVVIAHGGLPKKKQDIRLKKFKAGKIPILVAGTELLGEGTDVPVIRTVVVCDGGKSVIRTVQRIGRGMRVHGDKKFVLVFDFMDYVHRQLEKHSKARFKACRREGYDVELEKI